MPVFNDIIQAGTPKEKFGSAYLPTLKFIINPNNNPTQ